jgi:hypothetical protein
VPQRSENPPKMTAAGKIDCLESPVSPLFTGEVYQSTREKAIFKPLYPILGALEKCKKKYIDNLSPYIPS